MSEQRRNIADAEGEVNIPRGIGIKERLALIEEQNNAAIADALQEAKAIADPVRRDQILQRHIEELKVNGRFTDALDFARLLSNSEVRAQVQEDLYAADMKGIELQGRYQRLTGFDEAVAARKKKADALPPEEGARAYIAIARTQIYGHDWLEDGERTLKEAANRFPGSPVVHEAYISYIKNRLESGAIKHGIKLAEAVITDEKERDALYMSVLAKEPNRSNEQVQMLLSHMSEAKRPEAALAHVKSFAFSKEKKHYDLAALAVSLELISDIQKRVDLIREAGAGYSSRIDSYDLKSLKSVSGMIPGEKSRHEFLSALGSNPGDLFVKVHSYGGLDEDRKVLETIALLMKGDAQNTDRMFSARARAELATNVFGPGAAIKDGNHKREVTDYEKQRFLNHVLFCADKISDRSLREEVYASVVARMSEATFKAAYRPQTAFYGENKKDDNRLIVILKAIRDTAVREKAAGDLVAGLEQHIENLMHAKKTKAPGTSMREREEIRGYVSGLAKKMDKQVSIQDPELLKRIKTLATV